VPPIPIPDNAHEESVEESLEKEIALNQDIQVVKEEGEEHDILERKLLEELMKGQSGINSKITSKVESQNNSVMELLVA
jgi:hypothetical protein